MTFFQILFLLSWILKHFGSLGVFLAYFSSWVPLPFAPVSTSVIRYDFRTPSASSWGFFFRHLTVKIEFNDDVAVYGVGSCILYPMNAKFSWSINSFNMCCVFCVCVCMWQCFINYNKTHTSLHTLGTRRMYFFTFVAVSLCNKYDLKSKGAACRAFPCTILPVRRYIFYINTGTRINV